MKGFKVPAQAKFKFLKESLILNSSSWNELSVFQAACKPALLALRLTDSDNRTLHEVAKAYFSVAEETPRQMQAVSILQDIDRSEMIIKVKEIIKKRENDCVSTISRAAAYVNPRFLYSATDAWTCPNASASFNQILADYMEGTIADVEKRVDSEAACQIEIAQFRRKMGWFGSKAAEKLASGPAYTFWMVAAENNSAENVGSLCIKLVTCVSGSSAVERHHKNTALIRNKRSNRKLSSTTAAYCNLKMSLSTQKKKDMQQPNIIQMFKKGMAKLCREREERVECAKAIAAARLLRASGGGDDDEGIESDGDRDEHVEFEEFLLSLDEQPSDEELDDHDD